MRLLIHARRIQNRYEKTNYNLYTNGVFGPTKVQSIHKGTENFVHRDAPSAHLLAHRMFQGIIYFKVVNIRFYRKAFNI